MRESTESTLKNRTSRHFRSFYIILSRNDTKWLELAASDRKGKQLVWCCNLLSGCEGAIWCWRTCCSGTVPSWSNPVWTDVHSSIASKLKWRACNLPRARLAFRRDSARYAPLDLGGSNRLELVAGSVWASHFLCILQLALSSYTMQFFPFFRWLGPIRSVS